MDPSVVIKLILLIILLIGSAFFSATETALTSISKLKIEQWKESNDIKGIRVAHLLEDPTTLLGAILIGNNIVNIAASSLITILIIDTIGPQYVGVGTIVLTILILIFGEITPKSLASMKSEEISKSVSGIIGLLMKVLKPIIIVLNVITGFFIKLLGGDPDEIRPLVTQEELMTALSVGHEEGILEMEEKDMISNVFEFSDTSLREVMVPRTEMVAIDINAEVDEFLEIYQEAMYSRIPVFEESIDDIAGILYAKDLLFIDKDNFKISDYLREASFSYDFTSTKEVFQEMRNEKTHMMIVLDEYGGTAGLVTIEDLIEEIVGEIEDEYDIEPEIITEDKYTYYVNGAVKIDDINEFLDTEIHSEEFDSIGGYILGELGRFPEQGEVLLVGNIEFTIEETDGNKIEKIKLHIIDIEKS